MQKRRLIYTAIKRPLIKKIFLTLLVVQKTLYTFWSTDENIYPSVFNLGPRAFSHPTPWKRP